MEQGKIEIIGDGPIFADPGEVAEGSLALERPGRYVAVCFIPSGMVREELKAMGVTEDMPPEEWPEEAQAILQNPPHVALGMIQEFTVTADEAA